VRGLLGEFMDYWLCGKREGGREIGREGGRGREGDYRHRHCCSSDRPFPAVREGCENETLLSALDLPLLFFLLLPPFRLTSFSERRSIKVLNLAVSRMNLICGGTDGGRKEDRSG
jgi:hypothetical protein